MRKTLSVVFVCMVCVFSFQAFTTHQQPQWKNLQILPQDISEDGLDSVMHHFTHSLGVKCNYCHAGNPAERKMDFPSDAKPEKLIARKMMQMTIDINKNHFQQIAEMMDSGEAAAKADTSSVSYMLKYVTCYTCHHGDPHPENQPPKEDNMGGHRPPPPPPPAKN